eukprot:13749920-Alexandrium_andersonii.AAC.1
MRPLQVLRPAGASDRALRSGRCRLPSPCPGRLLRHGPGLGLPLPLALRARKAVHPRAEHTAGRPLLHVFRGPAFAAVDHARPQLRGDPAAPRR